MSTYTTVVLAAGKGTRMRSRLPKVLHSIAGRPLIGHVLAAIAAIPPAADLSPEPPVLVLGHEAEHVRSVLGDGYRYVYQREQLGTGHAVRQALAALSQQGAVPRYVLVLYGDTPLVTSMTLASLLGVHCEQAAVLTLASAIVPDPTGYGRILRDVGGRVQGIREEKDCETWERAITEVNAGMYCFDATWLVEHLPQLYSHPDGEYYLPDLVELAVRERQPIATVRTDWEEILGVNDRRQLAEAGAILRQRILVRHMLAGVTIVDPATTYIDDDVVIGQDTIIAPCTTIRSGACIGAECVIGPCSTIIGAAIGDRCVVPCAWVEHGVLCAGSMLDPYTVLRRQSDHRGTMTMDGLEGEPPSGPEPASALPLLEQPLRMWSPDGAGVARAHPSTEKKE